MIRPPPRPPLFPYTTLFRSIRYARLRRASTRDACVPTEKIMYTQFYGLNELPFALTPDPRFIYFTPSHTEVMANLRSEEHTSELQSLTNLVCRLLLEKKKSH